jgi:putative hydrolase of the HAD superfamily
MIRTIFFDYDGVLTTDKSGSLTTHRYLSDATGVALPAIGAAFSPHAGDLLTGKLRYAQIWPTVCQALRQELDIGLLAGAFESTPLNAGMLSLARRLSAHYPVGIITDNNKDRMEHLRRFQDLDALFDPIVVSAEVGGSKLGKEIFLHALSCANALPHESVFIDNSESNLVMARALGMHAIFHDNERNDIDALTSQLEQLGVRTENAQALR